MNLLSHCIHPMRVCLTADVCVAAMWDRAFSVAAPQLRNSLSQAALLSPTLPALKQTVKMFGFCCFARLSFDSACCTSVKFSFAHLVFWFLLVVFVLFVRVFYLAVQLFFLKLLAALVTPLLEQKDDL